MSYSNPTVVNYSRAIGTSSLTWTVSPPRGATQCRVVGISASATTTFTNTGNDAKVEVGVSGSYNVAVAGSLTIGALAAGNTVGMTFTQGVNPLIPVIDLTGASNPGSNTTTAQAAIEVLGPVQIKFTASAGGSPAGVGYIDVTLAWF